jgi:hypothetical protein
MGYLNSLLIYWLFIFLGENAVNVQLNSMLCPAPVLSKAGE